MDIEKPIVLDLLETKGPALSATSDVPVIETHPDSVQKPDAPAAEEKVETKSEESASPEGLTEDSSAAPDEVKKPAKGVQKRIDELTRQREDERRAREAAEARELRILSALEKVSGVSKELPPGTEDKEPVKPQKTDFDNPDAYDAALETYVTERASYEARKEVKAQIEAQQKRSQEEANARRAKEAQETFQKRVETAKQKYPDYQQVAESPDVQVSFPMAYAILNSERGPDIQYYLGKNPAEAKRISDMVTTDNSGNQVPDVARQLVELGVISAKLNQPVTPKPVSAAPKPIAPLSKTTDTAEKSPEEMSMDEYAAYRKPQLNKRPGVRN